jgi:hypothetical protein
MRRHREGREAAGKIYMPEEPANEPLVLGTKIGIDSM